MKACLQVVGKADWDFWTDEDHPNPRFLGIKNARVFEIGSLYYKNRVLFDKLKTPEVFSLTRPPPSDSPTNGEYLSRSHFLGYFTSVRVSKNSFRDSIFTYGEPVNRDGSAMPYEDYRWDITSDPNPRKEGDTTQIDAQRPPSNTHSKRATSDSGSAPQSEGMYSGDQIRHLANSQRDFPDPGPPEDPAEKDKKFRNLFTGLSWKILTTDANSPDLPWSNYWFQKKPNMEAYRINTVGGVPGNLESTGSTKDPGHPFLLGYKPPVRDSNGRDFAFQIVIYRKGCQPGISTTDASPPLLCAPSQGECSGISTNEPYASFYPPRDASQASRRPHSSKPMRYAQPIGSTRRLSSPPFRRSES